MFIINKKQYEATEKVGNKSVPSLENAYEIAQLKTNKVLPSCGILTLKIKWQTDKRHGIK